MGNGSDVHDCDASAADTQQESVFPAHLLEMDTEFVVLSHPRRRYLLYTLAEQSQWSLGELATKLAAWELDVEEEAVTTDQRDKVYVSLVHAHVPRLIDEGVVTLDPESEVLSKGEHADQLLASLSEFGGSTDSDQESHAERPYNE